jgi:pimeloyl-ACP methyl ester carboxylesterase
MEINSTIAGGLFLNSTIKMKKHITEKTSDGWELPLIQYSSMNTVATPVILCHGLAANKHSVDFGEFESDDWTKYSLACYLSNYLNKDRKSFDVWVPQLRGRGKNPTFNPDDNPEKYHWTVDDYINKDVPVIIDYIRKYYSETKSYSPKVYWIGKSMGGMIAYAYGETEGGYQHFKGVVTIGSPTAFQYWNTQIEIIARMAPRNFSFPVNPSEFFNNHPMIKEKFMESAANEENIDDGILEDYIDVGMNNNISSKVLNQFMTFYRHNDFCKYPQQPWVYDAIGRIPLVSRLVSPYSYKRNLSKFKTPLFAVAGGKDNAAPPQDVKYSSYHVGSHDVTYRNFCEETGCTHDYGHFDLNMGLHVKEEVYHYIYEWLIHQEKMSKQQYH